MKTQSAGRVSLVAAVLLLSAGGGRLALAQSATGTIAASPDPCMIPSGQTACTTAVTWSTANVTSASVTVQDAAGGVEGEAPVPAVAWARIQEEIENLPVLYKLEVVDFKQVSPTFKRVVGQNVELISP